MRCPKCGYISFDRQKSCGKCSNDLTAVAEELRGTAGKAAVPLFLGAVLGKQKPSEDEAAPAPYEEEEPFTLDELEVEPPSAEVEELDFAGAPLDEDDLAGESLPSLGLEDIDVSDLVPPQEEEEEQALSLSSEQKEELQGIEFSNFDTEEDTLQAEEKEQTLDLFDTETAAPSAPSEEDEIIDLSSLMSFDETPEPPADTGEDSDMLELSLEDEEDEPAEEPKKSASTVADMLDLDLTLEKDDK